MNFIVFFATVLIVYTFGNWYIWRGLRALLPQSGRSRLVFNVAFIILSLTFFTGRILEHIALSWFSDAIVWTGSFWLGAMLYLLLAVLLIDLAKLTARLSGLHRKLDTRRAGRLRRFAFAGALTATSLLLVAGRINQRNPVIESIELIIPKKGSARDELRLAVVSDIHLGTIICSRHVDDIVARINDLHPEMILLVGDILDEDLGPVVRQNLGARLRVLSAPLGVYGVTGNHEYIGGIEPAVSYLTEHGVMLLRDTAISIDGIITLVGREDHAAETFAGISRRPLADILRHADTTLPMILMDHQPRELEDARINRISLQLSGHVHHGQLWPLNYVTGAIYEVSRGYKRKGDTQYYVSSGVGSWGPPVRIGSRPEILDIRIRFK